MYYKTIFITLLSFIMGINCAYGETESDLAKRIEKVLKHKDFESALVGVYVESIDEDRVWYNHNGNITMIPASNNKILTTAAAMDLLGPDYIYSTTFAFSGKINSEGILKGNLVVIGSGDPTISGRFNKGNVTQTFEEWAEKLKTLGIKKVEGDLIGDDNYFDDQVYSRGWFPYEFGEWYQAPVGALAFNDNCVDMKWKAGRKVGSAAVPKFTLPFPYLDVINKVVTVEKNKNNNRYYFRWPSKKEVEVTGSVPLGKISKLDSTAVDNPTTFFIETFYHVLEKKGISISGKALDIDILETTPDNNNLTIVSVFQSPRLKEIIDIINLRSQNFYAEQVFKTIGKIKYGKGSFYNGRKAVTDFFKKNKIETSGLRVRDGSGLSWMNLVQPSQLAKVLKVMAKHEFSEEYMDTFPHAGVKGSIKSRFRNNDKQKKIAKKVLGKTGYISGTYSLSGYVETAGGNKLVYSVIVNHYLGNTSRVKPHIDAIVTEIAVTK